MADLALAGQDPAPNFRRRLNFLTIASVLVAAMVMMPLLLVFSGWLQPESEVWKHLAETLLADLIINTLVLLAGVAAGVLLLGVGLAWLVVMVEFPGRRFFEWALILPLAVPAYVLAFVAVGVLDFSGPVQQLLRTVFAELGWFPQIRSTGGVIAVMILVLYPYVYMLARTAFLTQGHKTVEAARMLGLNAWQSFFRVSLPMARPAIVAGTSLALMETLADFGAVSVFNYDTFTTAIYKAWFGLFNLQAASQLASLLLVFVAVALLLEQQLRSRARFDELAVARQQMAIRPGPLRAWLVTGLCLLVFVLAFALPFLQLLSWSWQSLAVELDARYIDLLLHTLLLGLMASLVAVVAAMLLGLANHNRRNPLARTSQRIATMGYALPGSVLAVGIMFSVTGMDNLLNALQRMLGMQAAGPLLGGTVMVLIIAYMVRFLAVAHGPVDSGLQRIRPGLLDASRSLGCAAGCALWRVYLPLLRPGLLTAALMVLVDVMKEMPITLLLRPYGWDTLAVRIYEMTSEGEWERAALPALTLILLGLLPVILIVRQTRKPLGSTQHGN